MPIYQFLLLITPDKITVVCSQKKADIIETLKQGDKQIALEVIRRGKNGEENVPLYENVVKQLNNVGFFFVLQYVCLLINVFLVEKSGCFCQR
jgi:nucleosome binding factor SPN SPT16 subunit